MRSVANPVLSGRGRSRGFTMIEVMVVVVVIGVLAAIAIPSYRSYIERGHRASAKTTLLEAAQFMERFRSANFSYAVPTSSPPAPPTLPGRLAVSPPEGMARYTISVETPTASSFVLTATPQGWTDTLCGNLTLNSLGQKGQSLGDAATCWNK